MKSIIEEFEHLLPSKPKVKPTRKELEFELKLATKAYISLVTQIIELKEKLRDPKLK